MSIYQAIVVNGIVITLTLSVVYGFINLLVLRRGKVKLKSIRFTFLILSIFFFFDTINMYYMYESVNYVSSLKNNEVIQYEKLHYSLVEVTDEQFKKIIIKPYFNIYQKDINIPIWDYNPFKKFIRVYYVKILERMNEKRRQWKYDT